MNYLSICSGMEAASLAFDPLGWKPLAFAEIEPAPRALLKERFPDVPLHGDFTKLRDEAFIVDADMLVGGTPCQGFSVAGLRGSLNDDRSNLCLEFVRLANAIDDLRRAAGREPCWALWENVPGVFSTGDNAFGAFLGGLVGSDAPIVPVNGWTDAGVVDGPRRCAAWRTLDAQHFGLAQRRARVFVLAIEHPRGWAAPDALLPIAESVRWHPAPRRQAGQRIAGTVAGGARSRGGYSHDDIPLSCAADAAPGLDLPRMRGGERGDERGADSGDDVRMVRAFGGNNTAGPIEVAAFSAHAGPHGRQDFATETFVIQAGALRENPDAGPDGVGVSSGPAYTLEARAEVQAVAYGIDSDCFDRSGEGADASAGSRSGLGIQEELSSALRAKRPNAVAFKASHYTRDKDGAPNEIAPPLSADADKGDQDTLVLAFSCKDHGADVDEIAPTLRAMSHAKSHANAGGQVAVAQVVADPITASFAKHHGASAGKDSIPRNHVLAGYAVRRLTPRECERLQGAPDDWTLVQYRGKPMADGPRYKMLGNSWAVPCVRYIGERIDAVRRTFKERAA